MIIANDILPVLRPKQKRSLKVARWATVGLGGVALLIALSEWELLDLILLSACFYAPIVVIPMLLAIFGFQTSRRVVLVAMVAGCTTAVACLAYFKNTNGFFPGMIANFIVLLGAHYLLGEKGGWGNNPVEGEPTPLLQRITWKERLATAKRFKLYPYLERVLPRQEYAYLLLGFYIFTTTYALFYLFPQEVALQYPGLYRGIQYSVTLITTSFLAFPIWPKPLQSKRFFVWMWPVAIFYTLFVVGGLLVIMSGFALPQMLLLALNFVMALLLLHWPLALGTAISGILVAILFFKQYTGLERLPGDLGSIQSQIIYGLLLLSSFLIALCKHKQDKAKLEDQNIYLLTTQKKTNTRLFEALQYREQFLKELNPDEVAIFDNTTAAYIQQAIYRVKDYLRLDVSKTSIDQLQKEARATLKLQDLQPNPQILLREYAKYQELACDVAKISQLLVNSLSYVQRHNQDNRPITIGLEEATLGYELSHMKDYKRKIKALKITITTEHELPSNQELYMVSLDSSSVQLPQSEENLVLAENSRIVDAHYGYVETMTDHTQVYVIPVNLREVRGKVMELLREPVAADPEELKDPLAIQLEKELLEKLQDTDVDLEIIHQALKTIKKYHGSVKRKSGEPFFTHPIAVALILLEYTQDQAAVLAALLHDTVEDTSLSLAHIRAVFGETVAFLVGKATNLEDKIRRLSLADHENIHRLMNYEDIRAVLVKLSDRLHNMRTIGTMPPDKQQRIAHETFTFFVPMAKNLAPKDMAQELEQLSLAILNVAFYTSND